MIRLPPSPSPSSTRFPYTPLFLSALADEFADLEASLAGIAGGCHGDSCGCSELCRISLYFAIDVKRNLLKARFRCLCDWSANRSEEHTSELQSLMRISYAVFCLKQKHEKKKTI